MTNPIFPSILRDEILQKQSLKIYLVTFMKTVKHLILRLRLVTGNGLFEIRRRCADVAAERIKFHRRTFAAVARRNRRAGFAGAALTHSRCVRVFKYHGFAQSGAFARMCRLISNLTACCCDEGFRLFAVRPDFRHDFIS